MASGSAVKHLMLEVISLSRMAHYILVCIHDLKVLSIPNSGRKEAKLISL